jgi:hypothetical protein
LRKEDQKFEDSWAYIARHCLKNNEKAVDYSQGGDDSQGQSKQMLQVRANK